MPTYEYVCENEHTFEEFQSIVAVPIEICPICGARAERKISGGSGLIFRGSGFYINDYARKGGEQAKDSVSLNKEKPKESDSASTSSTGSDATKTTPASGSSS